MRQKKQKDTSILNEILAITPKIHFAKTAVGFAHQNLNIIQFQVLALRALVKPEKRLSLEDISQKINIPLIEVEKTFVKAQEIFCKEAKKAGRFYYVEYIKENIKEPLESVPEQPAEDSVEDIVSEGNDDQPELENEQDILRLIQDNGFDGATLLKLGAVYEEQSELKLALCCYGAALDILESEPGTLEKLLMLERRLGIKYNPDVHYSEIEGHINNCLDSDPKTAQLKKAFGETIAVGGEGQRQEADNDYKHVGPEGEEQARTALFPTAIYAIPAEALAPGKRLTMRFKPISEGGLEVTMEVSTAAQRPNVTESDNNTSVFNGSAVGMQVHVQETKAGPAVFIDGGRHCTVLRR